MPEDSSLIFCYNRGCAMKFDPTKNTEGNNNYFFKFHI